MAARAFWLRMGWRIVLATGGWVVLVHWLGGGGAVPGPRDLMPPRRGAGRGPGARLRPPGRAAPDAGGRPGARVPVGRRAAHGLHRLRRRRGRAGLIGLLAVLWPGLLAGLSDDDPAGITTYSILGAQEGYRLLWVLALSTLALIVFHELVARTGVATGKGLVLLVRERVGGRASTLVVGSLVVANVGTVCAELAGVAVGAELLTGAGRSVSVLLAAPAVSALVLRSGFHRVEHVLLAQSLAFMTRTTPLTLPSPPPSPRTWSRSKFSGVSYAAGVPKRARASLVLCHA